MQIGQMVEEINFFTRGYLEITPPRVPGISRSSSQYRLVQPYRPEFLQVSRPLLRDRP